MVIYRLQKFSTFAFLIMVSFSLLSGPGSSKVQAFDDASEIKAEMLPENRHSPDNRQADSLIK